MKVKERIGLQRLFRIMYETEVEVGKNNEQRTLRAFTDEYPFRNRIPWIHSARLSTEEEDAEGIDLVFETDVGQIHLQLKSSERGRTAFLGEQARGLKDAAIVCAIVKPHYDAKEIYRAVMPTLSRERRRRLQARKGRVPVAVR